MDLSSDLIGLLQWPAMLASLLAAWLVGSNNKHRRNIGFWVFLVSNVLWTVWGWHESAWALIALQVALAVLNIRGVFKTESPSSGHGEAKA
jgi:hypothetical protein